MCYLRLQTHEPAIKGTLSDLRLSWRHIYAAHTIMLLRAVEQSGATHVHPSDDTHHVTFAIALGLLKLVTE
jgi:hypothetical protein